jgi:hypothetical protein
MQLTIDGQAHDLTPIKAFRAAHELPAEFAVALFEPKDWSGLGRVESAGAEMNAVRAAVLSAIPERIPLAEMNVAVDTLAQFFRAQLYGINEAVGLKSVEIDFAASGFFDVAQAYVYGLIHARLAKSAAPTYPEIYEQWYQSSVRLAQTVHEYAHHGETWHVQVISNAYGRCGLRIVAGESVQHVYDGALGCPAEGFMGVLLGDVCARLQAAFV